MRSLVLLISILLASFVLNDSCTGKDATKYDDCKNLQKSDPSNYCCFVESEYTVGDKEEKHKGCLEITKKDYDNIKDYVKEIKSEAEKSGVKDISYDIDCSCSYLTISLLGLIILLI